MSSNNQPIFIVGVHRSGTTLLRYMLNSSPRIYVPPESDFIPRFFGRRPLRVVTPAQADRMLALVFGRYRFSKEWQGSPLIAADLSTGDAPRSQPEITPRVFLEALYGAYARQAGATRWGDKTPIYTSYIDLIHQILPDALFVHLIRDGRDVALSMLDKWGEREFHVDLYYAARTWTKRIRQARASGARLGPGAYYELRYESLVVDPEGELRRLCSFLAEPYVPAMAQPQRLAKTHIGEHDFHAALRKPPSNHRAGRWRVEMAEADLRLFERVAGGLLAELGYGVAAEGSMSARERVRATWLATKYCTLQAGRSLLQTIGLVPPI